MISEGNFISKTSSALAQVCDVSFIEMSQFLQKNFEMAVPASQVIATRLHETFTSFDLPTHPWYFAGIPRNVLMALLQANRRTELIELAVVGYLTFVVADDNEEISLSRTTRELFLTWPAVKINIDKAEFTEEQVVSAAKDFAGKFDFSISPARFIAAFMQKSILHVEQEKVRFTLPFMEAYLLAKYLSSRPEEALNYFKVRNSSFDQQTFSLYSELGAGPELIQNILEKLDASISALHDRSNGQNILLGIELNPAYLARPEHLQAFQRRVEAATADVVSDRDVSSEKQKFLDTTDQIREQANRQTKDKPNGSEDEKKARYSVERSAIGIWMIAISLLGSGAERLEAPVKRLLIQKIVKLSCFIIDDWTRSQLTVDFAKMKTDLTENDETLRGFAATQDMNDLSSIKKTVENVIDLMEYQILTLPFVFVISTLCEEARDNVLAESVVNSELDEEFATLIKSMWLSDIKVSEGKAQLRSAIKALPRAGFLRVNVASHLIARAYWKHWRKDDRLALLDAANECLKPLGKQYNKSPITRMIQSEIQEGRSKS